MKYFWLTLKHKWFVFIAGLKIDAPLWRIITHDLSKLTWTEYRHYQRQFFGAADRPGEFARAWLHHQNSNDHHWEWWIPRTGHNKSKPPYPDNVPMVMPVEAVKEMVSDWMGAGRAYDGYWPNFRSWPWLKKNLPIIKERVHPETFKRIINILTELRINYD